MASDQDRLNRYLNEALATERALVSTLTAHIAMTPRSPYRELLQRHLRETKAHADALSDHATAEHHEPLVNTAIGLAETVVGQALTLAKGPLDLVRGGPSTQERLLKNAKDECATEALEIATYDAIEALANQLGEAEIAAPRRPPPGGGGAHAGRPARAHPELAAPRPAAAPGKRDPAGRQPDRRLRRAQRGPGRRAPQPAHQDQLAAPCWPTSAPTATGAPWSRGSSSSRPRAVDGYDEDSEAAAIVGRLTGAPRSRVRDYESRHRRRVTVLEAAQRELSRPG